MKAVVLPGIGILAAGGSLTGILSDSSDMIELYSFHDQSWHILKWRLPARMVRFNMHICDHQLYIMGGYLNGTGPQPVCGSRRVWMISNDQLRKMNDPIHMLTCILHWKELTDLLPHQVYASTSVVV
jgi:hypothetical protein